MHLRDAGRGREDEDAAFPTPNVQFEPYVPMSMMIECMRMERRQQGYGIPSVSSDDRLYLLLLLLLHIRGRCLLLGVDSPLQPR